MSGLGYFQRRRVLEPDRRFVFDDHGARDASGVWIRRSATFSVCGRFRYVLERGSFPFLAFVMLNPSTADGNEDDPTIRRCLGFARSSGFKGIEVLNLYAYRSTSPAECLAEPDRVGLFNDDFLKKRTDGAKVVACAWGAHAEPERAEKVLEIIRANKAKPMSFGTNANGSPKHPLYLPGTSRLELYKGAKR